MVKTVEETSHPITVLGTEKKTFSDEIHVQEVPRNFTGKKLKKLNFTGGLIKLKNKNQS